MAFDKETGKEAGKLSKRGKDTVLKELRENYSELLNNNQDKLQKWLDEVAINDPAKALELVLKIGSYVIAKPRSVEIKSEHREQPLFPNIIDLGKGTMPLSELSDEEFKRLNDEYEEEEKRRK